MVWCDGPPEHYVLRVKPSDMVSSATVFRQPAQIVRILAAMLVVWKMKTGGQRAVYSLMKISLNWTFIGGPA
jgi:type 1 glutamine amidotransferase